MIDIQSQNDLFKLIGAKLKNPIIAYVFGGTAMMYYGYKNATKDIDMVFESDEQRKAFVEVILSLNYERKSVIGVYIDEKTQSPNKPLMFSRGDERFDLFSERIFQTILTENMKKRFYARHDFGENLIIYVMSKEDIILLKSVTEREKDFDDILTIIEKERKIDWDYIVDNAINQKKLGDSWILLDLEKTLQRLREYTLIKKKYFDRLYDARE
ncbi:hypothetical protein GOV08_03740 [Candidatus Woesearchaeota archaeon]|nr:hypothetical protein [Candidatus Woesearchaeota archaeon]